MKKFYFAIFALISSNAFGQTVVDFEDFTLSGAETYFDGSDLSGTSNGFGLFETIITEGELSLNSIYDTTWGASSGYWSKGWAVSNETSDTAVGSAGLFSTYAGGGDASSNFVIGQNGSIITKTDLNAEFQSIRISNNNYAASSMLMGDAFAKKFGGASGDDADWFLLTIVGYSGNDNAIDSVEFYLADYRFSDNSQDYIVKDWTTVDLSSISSSEYLKFKQSSSDVGGFGMNTPGFFTADKVVYDFPVSVLENENFEVTVYPNPTSSILNVTSRNDVQQFYISNLQGQVVKSELILGDQKSINVENLPSGFYHITMLSNEGTSSKKFQKI
jgi:hypothetical protein